MKRQKEKVIKGRGEWRRQSEVRRLRIIMTIVAVILGISIAAGLILAWLQVKNQTAKRGTASSAPVATGKGMFPAAGALRDFRFADGPVSGKTDGVGRRFREAAKENLPY